MNCGHEMANIDSNILNIKEDDLNERNEFESLTYNAQIGEELPNDKKIMKIKFINPINKQNDHVFVKYSDMQKLKMEQNNNKGKMWIISFLEMIDEKVYVMNLHIDDNFIVRSITKNRFFFNINNTLHIQE